MIFNLAFLKKLFRLRMILCLLGFLVACAEVKQAGRTVGHTTRDVTREIGHGTRDVAKTIGHGTRNAVHGIGQGVHDSFRSSRED